MGYHHLALAVSDMAATNRFYSEVMGFELAKVVVGPTDNPGGWAKHVFYDTGDGSLIAFWELHDATLPDFDPAISTALGLPPWVNHVAFHAELDELPARRERWLDAACDVVEIDHGFCVSIYALDPNGILVEWCADTRPLNETDRAEARAALADPHPPHEEMPTPVFYEAKDRVPAS